MFQYMEKMGGRVAQKLGHNLRHDGAKRGKEKGEKGEKRRARKGAPQVSHEGETGTPSW